MSYCQLNKKIRILHLALNRTERFCEGTIDSIIKKRNDIIIEIFGNRKMLERTGLSFAYEQLTNEIYDADILILGSLLQNDSSDLVVNKYTTNQGKTITLTIGTIMTGLIKYLDYESISNMCDQSSLYSKYSKEIK